MAWSHGPSSPRLDSVSEGTYVLATTDARGCARVDTVEVPRAVAVEVDVDVAATTCYGESDGSIVATGFGGSGPYLYALDDETARPLGDYRFLPAGEYAVTAYDRNGCPSPRTVVEVEQPQPLIVEAGDFIALELGGRTRITADVYNAVGEVRYRWSPRDSSLFSCGTCAVTDVTGSYQGTLRVDVSDERGCLADDVIQVRVSKVAPVLVPTGFRPDADGEDDRLLVHGKTGTQVRLFQVFNRWGQVVHEAEDFAVNSTASGWDGTYLDTYAPAGTYIWRVEVEFLDGSVETASGQTTLIR